MMVVACLQRMVITNISFLILVIVLKFKESQHSFLLQYVEIFLIISIYVKICKNHRSDKFFSPVIVNKIF